MAKWSKVEAGDNVELKGRVFEVVKIKVKGEHAKVTVRGAGSVFESKVLLADKVKVVTPPLHDKSGAQARWAKPKENTMREPAGLEAGNPAVTKPPVNANGDPWETRRDKVERRLDDLLGAKLVGETNDASAGYYVPPVDITIVAAHLALFHGVKVGDYGIDDMLELHQTEHRNALMAGAPGLAVNHWHTEVRP